MANGKKQELRQPILMVGTGFKGTGKSIETIKTLYEAKDRGRKSIIFDTNNEFSNFLWIDGEYRKIPCLKIADIPKFSMQRPAEVFRIPPHHDDGRPMTLDEKAETLLTIVKYFRNGILLVEDINQYTGDHLRKDFVGALISGRHIGLDIIVHYQNIGRIGHPKILGNLNVMRLHYTNDRAKTYGSRFQDQLEILTIAENIVRSKFDVHDSQKKYYHLYIHFLEGKIKGNFTKDDAENAVTDYIDNNWWVVTEFLNKRDRKTARKLYNEKEAYEMAITQLTDKYFEFKRPKA